MRPSPRKPLDDLDELRQLLIRPEQEELRELHDRLDDKEQRAHEVAEILPEAVTLSGDRSEDLTRALRPAAPVLRNHRARRRAFSARGWR